MLEVIRSVRTASITVYRNNSTSNNSDGGVGSEHPGGDGVWQSKPAVFLGGSKPPSLAPVDLVGAPSQEGTALREGAKINVSELPEAPRGVIAGLGQGQDENPGWSLQLEFPWSEAASKANLASAIRDNGGQQKKYQA